MDCSTRVESILKDISHGVDDDVLRTFAGKKRTASGKFVAGYRESRKQVSFAGENEGERGQRDYSEDELCLCASEVEGESVGREYESIDGERAS